MASSDRLVSVRSIVALTLPFALVVACAQVTGLSDDYHYDLPSGGGDDASVSTDGSSSDARSDALASSDGGDRCTAQERTQAQTTIGQANGADVPQACRTCLAANCCDEIAACGRQNECVQSMSCVFGCQKNGNKGQCVNGCRDVFANVVGPCIQRSCASVCSLSL